MFRCFQTYCTFATVNYGALAHLARVRHWQWRVRVSHAPHDLSDFNWRFLVLRVAFFYVHTDVFSFSFIQFSILSLSI